jgi:protein involved in polysaccharide export with SLBB domain
MHAQDCSTLRVGKDELETLAFPGLATNPDPAPQAELASCLEDGGQPVVDSTHMNRRQCGMDIGVCNTRFASGRSSARLLTIRQIGPFILAVLLAATGYSQNTNSGATQTPTVQDCTDPLMASAPECTAQNQQDTNSTPASQGRPTPVPANGNYSDIEQLSRQPGARNQNQQQVLPPEPPTEFQNFVTSTTGQSLPIYGAKLFGPAPSTFAPLDMAPVPPDYVIGPNDELRIRVWGQVNFQANVRVDRSGDIFLQQIGPVHVAGMPFSELDSHLRSAIGRVYHNFDLTVDVGQIRAIQIYVSGEARRPGVYTVSSLSTLVDALFSSGGPSVQGSLRHIQLRRGSALITDFDLYNLLINGDKSKDVKLESGDVIFIPPVGAQAAVTGSVRNPAIYELVAGESLGALLANAGGVSTVASGARVSIERIDEHRDRQAMEVAYDPTGLTTTLADGDLVRVYSILPKYQKTVILRGNTANPGRFAWHPGMHVSDLIPDKDSLITRNYWWRRARLGLPAPEELDAPTPPVMHVGQNQQVTLNQFQNQFQNQGQYQYPYQNQYPNQNQPNQGQSPGLYPFVYQNEGQDSNLNPGLNQNQYPNQSQNQNPNQPQNQNPSAQQRTGGSSLASAEGAAGSTRNYNFGQRNVIRELAPEIDWDYAVIERLDADTLKSLVIPFDLGKLVLQRDASQDLELQAGDVVSIFSQADFQVPIAHQTKQVKLDGEFPHAGVYTAQPGETLRHLVERAGGLTPNAYLYGSEFTRESTRAVQQARIDEYVQSLGMQIQRGNLALAASATSSTQDLASGAAAQSNEQDLLASLRQIRATGRIVLRFMPESEGINTIPDVPLEDGDIFLVPPVPASVNVVGAVYDQNSFLYMRGARVGTYLRYAGGADRDGDRKHEFVIRANGDVVSYDRNKGVWGSDFANLRISPGDTVVVPEKTFRPSALRGFIDWSQLFSQFALGAAALSILK